MGQTQPPICLLPGSRQVERETDHLPSSIAPSLFVKGRIGYHPAPLFLSLYAQLECEADQFLRLCLVTSCRIDGVISLCHQ
jgi:hypothetical protein